MKFFEQYVSDKLKALEAATVTNQEKINAVSAALELATAGLRADIADLKAKVAAGETLDFGPLDAKVAALAALDAEHPPTP